MLIGFAIPFFISWRNDSGGGFDSGSSSDPKIDGSFLAAKVQMSIKHQLRLKLNFIYVKLDRSTGDRVRKLQL